MLSVQLTLSIMKLSAPNQGTLLPTLSLGLPTSSDEIMTVPSRNANRPTGSRQTLFETLFLGMFRLCCVDSEYYHSVYCQFLIVF